MLINKGLYDLRVAVSRLSRLKISACISRMRLDLSRTLSLAASDATPLAHADGAQHQIG